MDIITIQMILITIPLYTLSIYIYYKTRLNAILLFIAMTTIVLTIKILELFTYQSINVNGTNIIGITPLILMAGYIPIIYLMIQDKLWNLITITGLLLTVGLVISTNNVSIHGEYIPVTCLIIWTWYKTSGRCFNAVTCPLNQLEGRWR